MMTEFFFDTYAFIEILDRNKDYEAYTNAIFAVTKLNLFELYHILLKREDPRAEHFLKKCLPFAVDFDENDIIAAAHLKRKNRRLSMADCIGYVTARRLGIRFLTGDKEFKGMEQVEFVQ